MKMKPNRLFLTLAITAAAALGLPALVAAHHITSIEVVCGQGISASGAGFSTTSNSPVTVSGPDGYLESFVVPSASWSHTFPSGPDGDYSLDWPNSGDNGPVAFSVECAEEEPTPTPEPATPTGQASVRCDPDQDPGYILTYGARNPTDEPIEVVLFLDGADSGVAPMVVGPGHASTRNVDYDHQQRVTLYLGETVLFDQILRLPVCGPGVTVPPTAEAAIGSGSSSDIRAPIGAFVVFMAFILLAPRFRRTFR